MEGEEQTTVREEVAGHLQAVLQGPHTSREVTDREIASVTDGMEIPVCSLCGVQLTDAEIYASTALDGMHACIRCVANAFKELCEQKTFRDFDGKIIEEI